MPLKLQRGYAMYPASPEPCFGGISNLIKSRLTPLCQRGVLLVASLREESLRPPFSKRFDKLTVLSSVEGGMGGGI